MKPRLVRDHTGQLCMQLIHGQFTATLPIPEEIQKAGGDRARKFYELAEKTMSAELERKQTKLEKKQKGSDAVPVPVLRPRAWQKPGVDADAGDCRADERDAPAADGARGVPPVE